MIYVSTDTRMCLLYSISASVRFYILVYSTCYVHLQYGKINGNTAEAVKYIVLTSQKRSTEHWENILCVTQHFEIKPTCTRKNVSS